jgi:hypothetical protein
MFRLAGSVRLIALGVVALSLLVGGCSGKGKPTKANFEKIKDGDSVKDVEALLGPPAQTLDSKALKDMMGGFGDMFPGGVQVPGMDEAKKAIPDKIMLWKEGDAGYEVQFKDDKVSSKQAVTKEQLAKYEKKDSGTPDKAGEGKLTKANFERIKDDMSKEEVEKILGKDYEKASSVKVGDKEAKQYIWKSGNSTITIGFVDGKVAIKASVGLK